MLTNGLKISHITQKEFFQLKFSQSDKYCLGNRENLPQPIQLQLQKKVKDFSEFLTVFLKSAFNFEQLQKR